MHQTYTIPAANLAALAERIGKLNKRAAKLGVAPITYTTTHARWEEQIVRSGFEPRWQTKGDELKPDYKLTGRVREWLTLEVTGETPKYAGWEFIATLEPIMADGAWVNLLLCVPGQTLPPGYRQQGSICDHCRTARNRKQTFVVRYEDGTFKTVGRQCLKDFLGHTDPHKLAAWAEMLCELGSLCGASESEDWGGGCYAPDCYDLQTFLDWTTACVRKDGWVSRTKAREYDHAGRATADDVLYLLGRAPTGEARADWVKAREEREPNAEQKAEAEAALAWVREITDAECEENNYLANINAVAKNGGVTYKTAGLAASIVAAYAKAHDRLNYAARQAARPASNWVGTIGKRENFTVTVEKIIPVEGNYGSTGIHKMTTEAGDDVTWFASGSTKWLEPGQTLTVTATVKSHTTFENRKQTVLSRVVEYVPKAPRKTKQQKLAEAAKNMVDAPNITVPVADLSMG